MVTKKQVINYGGDALAGIVGVIAFIGFINPYVPNEYAGTLAIIALFLTRGSTLLAKLLEYLKSEDSEILDELVFKEEDDTVDSELKEAQVIAEEPVVDDEGC